MYVFDVSQPVYKNPFTDSDTVGFVYYRDKVLVLKKKYEAYGWKEIIYPIKGFVNEKSLVTEEEQKNYDEKINYFTRKNKNSRWTWKIKECPKNYILIKKNTDDASAAIGYLSEGEKFLFIKDGLNGTGIWTKIIYPSEGYIKTAEMLYESYPVIALGVSYGALNIPYEKNLKNYHNPLGGVIEFTKTNWLFSIAAGYSYSESRFSQYYLKTQYAFLQIKFKFLKLFNNKLEAYALAGGNYWLSSFQNLKYPSLTSTYYKKEEANTIEIVINLQ